MVWLALGLLFCFLSSSASSEQRAERGDDRLRFGQKQGASGVRFFHHFFSPSACVFRVFISSVISFLLDLFSQLKLLSAVKERFRCSATGEEGQDREGKGKMHFIGGHRKHQGCR